MQTLHATRKEIDLEQYKMRSALEQDFSTLVTTSTAVYTGDTLAIVYAELDLPHIHVVDALQKIKYKKGYRTAGLPSTSSIFGFAPRNPVRKDICSATSLAYNQPDLHQVVANYGVTVSQEYQRSNPELYAKHLQQTTDRVQPDYHIAQTPFTSGIINKNNPLKYHFDSGNFKDVWSGMIVFKHMVQGGYLSVPQLDLGFELKNNSLLLFDGQKLLHGVTPIKMLNKQSHRYSIVYYSLEQMWKCLPLGEELAWAKRNRTRIEENRMVSLD